MTLQFRVLGPVDLWRDGCSITVTGEKQRTLLAVLVMHAGQTVSRDRLLIALWGVEPPASARRLLHNYVWSLRRLLSDADALTRMPTGYCLRLAPGDSDLEVFLTTAQEGRRLAAAGEVEQAAQRFHQALALWRGPALTGTSAELQSTDGSTLDEQRIAVLVERISADLALGRHTELVGELRRLVTDHSLHEPLRGLLMLALYRAGRQAEALAVFRELRQVLNAELGTEPGPDLQRLHQRVLAADPALQTASPASAPAPAMARHVTAEAVSEDPTLSAKAAGPCQLPRAVGDFTSRDDEVARLVRATTGEEPSAVVIDAIDGMAGVGKTALAVHAAHRLAARFPDGQLYVNLHGHTPGYQPLPPLDALRTLLRAVGVPAEKIPDNVEEAAAAWRSAMAGRRMLIVLDDAATADQVRPLLLGRPGSHLIITSRRRLADLEDVAVLSLDVLTPDQATALFTRIIGVERARAETQAVAEVVGLCGYLPLALRLAAARLLHRPAWTVRDLAVRLSDQQHRLRELRAGDRDVATAFAVSYEQLTAAQQRMFRLLSLVPGDDFDAYAAAALTGLAVHEAEQCLEELLDAHLLQQHTAGRYRFHDLLRDYARQESQTGAPQVEGTGAPARLRDYYLATALRATQILGHRDPRRPLRTEPAAIADYPPLANADLATAWLETERGNLLTAALASQGEWAVDLSTALWRHLHFSAHRNEALALQEHAASVAHRLGDQEAQIQALIDLGISCCQTAQYEQALEHQRQALALACQIGDRAAQSRVLNNLGVTCSELGRIQESNDYFEQALILARDLNDRQRQRRALLNLGTNHNRLGDYPRALRYQQRSLTCAREIDDRAGESRALNNLGYTYSQTGRYELAESHCRLALTIARQIGNRVMEIAALNYLGIACSGLGRHQEALDHHHQALAFCRRADDPTTQVDVLVHLGNLCLRLGRYQDAYDHHRQALATLGETCDPVTKITVLNGLGRALCATGEPAAALDHYRQALALALDISHPYGRACAHRGIGDALHLTGHVEAATASWQQALGLFTALGVPEREEMSLRVKGGSHGGSEPDPV
ncbi:tetratricopeptide repeat protein [Planomonospora sp. ID67723]|uniref:AfsR/SARP family transcriptional regulator n=1 Tax=Planomonospora sp. ID67723 TaxID=2738134 RepID=UPI0018C41CE7|nr:tetratricopeptide repeat protein [Planomonospora sp. ID67723]MBG0830090.1 tetratricopeptide repeat protein [Planomonospora sp. ID67723]